MKLNIENKILIPFVILFFISMTVLLATSFRNDYNFIIDNQFRYMDERMNELERSFDYSIEGNNNAILIEQEVIKEMQAVDVGDLIILKNENVLLNSSEYSVADKKWDLQDESTADIHYVDDQYIMTSRYYEPLEWTLLLLEDKKQLLSFFYESYKYNFLTGIIFLTLSLQMTILIAGNITKPVQKLVKFCELVGKGEYEKKIVFKRKDEIGQLGLAFNQMIDQLNASINELISVKNYNQDILINIEKGIVIFDFNGDILSKNPFANQIIEEFDGYLYESQDLISIIEQIVFLTHVEQISKNKLFEFVRSSDGDIKVLDFYLSIMWGQKGNVRGYICSFNDITERRKLESRIQRLDRLATAGRLASGVAHEIRNPLTGMRTSIQVLKKRLKNVLSGNNEIMLNRLIKEIDRMNKLVSDLLDYSTRGDNQPAEVNVYQSVTDILALLDDEMESKGIVASIELKDKGMNFFIDPAHFNQILLNLIKNAMDAVSPFAGVIRIEGRYTDETRIKAELTISDNGSGIPLNLIEKVFDPFFTTKADGTGLGLFVVHELVQQNDGEIDVYGVKNEGTQMILRFKTGGDGYEQ